MLAVRTGVVHGRFQVLHLKELEYILAAKMRCSKLYIGITNPDHAYTRETINDPERSKKINNPMTFLERYEMIENTLLEFGVQREAFDIIPFPINRPDILLDYTPEDARYFMTIHDAWGEEKYQILTKLGLDVEVLWNRPLSEKGITGAEVRRKIGFYKQWDHLVPKAVYEYIVEKKIDERIIKSLTEIY